MNKIVSNDLLKALLNITGTSEDVRVDLYNTMMTEMLAEILGISDFARHTVTRERMIVPRDGSLLYFKEFPVQTSGITLEDMLYNAVTGYTFALEANALRTLRVISSSSVPTYLGHDELFVTYTAGFIVKDTIQVTDYANLVGKTMVVLNRVTGTETTYTFVASGATGNQINAATSDETTASNIATALTGTVSTDTCTLPLDKTINTTTSTLTSAQATVVSADLPLDLKMAISYLVGGGLQDRGLASNVASYTIGSKSVTFKSNSDADFFKTVAQKYTSGYNSVNILT